MKKIFFLIFFASIYSVKAHDANKAFFVVTQQENEVIVEAEFPWTIRKAIFKEFPILETTKNQQVFDDIVFKYMNKYLQLYTRNNEKLLLKSVQYVKKEKGHSHQNNYVITFKGNSFFKVENRLMFNGIRNQKNYHTLLLNGEENQFITTEKNSWFTQKTAHKNRNLKWFTLVALASLLFIIYKKKQ